MSEGIENAVSQRAVDSPNLSVVRANIQPDQANQALQDRTVNRLQEQTDVKTVSAASQSSSEQLRNLKALGNVKLSISIDDTKQLPVIKIFDDETGEELIQIPAEHSLNLSRTIKAAVGAIFDTKA